jgi:hypothetical protein
MSIQLRKRKFEFENCDVIQTAITAINTKLLSIERLPNDTNHEKRIIIDQYINVLTTNANVAMNITFVRQILQQIFCLDQRTGRLHDARSGPISLVWQSIDRTHQRGQVQDPILSNCHLIFAFQHYDVRRMIRKSVVSWIQSSVSSTMSKRRNGI